MRSEEKQSREETLEKALREARRMLGEIKYGSVTLVVQDSVVVQIERQEKLRLK